MAVSSFSSGTFDNSTFFRYLYFSQVLKNSSTDLEVTQSSRLVLITPTYSKNPCNHSKKFLRKLRIIFYIIIYDLAGFPLPLQGGCYFGGSITQSGDEYALPWVGMFCPYRAKDTHDNLCVLCENLCAPYVKKLRAPSW